MEKVIVISILAGIIIAAVLIIDKEEESFSLLYLYPESYTNYPAGDTTSFTFGVKSYEKERTAYDLEILIGDRLADTKHFEINPGEIHEENETLKLPDIEFPFKVDLILKSPVNTYSTHYWLMKPHEIQPQTPVVTPEVTSQPALAATNTPVQTSVPTSVPTAVPTSVPTATPSPAYTPTAGSTQNNSLPPIQVAVDARRGFSPKEISIKAGGSVMWTNRDLRDTKFTLVSKENLFTRVIDVEERYIYTFNTAGTYNFYLMEFPNSTGIVKVG